MSNAQTFPNEVELNLNHSGITSSGCLNASRALDNDPTTFAEFNPITSGLSPATVSPGAVKPSFDGVGNGVSYQYQQQVVPFNDPYVTYRTGTSPNIDIELYCAGLPGSSPSGGFTNANWNAWVLPKFSEIYTLKADPGTFANYCNSNTDLGSASVNVGGTSVINQGGFFNNSGGVTGTKALSAGIMYAITVSRSSDREDYFMRTLWQSASQTQQVIPQGQLFTSVPVPAINSFQAIYNGNGTATLSWNTSNAIVTFDQGIGQVSASGSLTVPCTVATVFTLTATGISYVDGSGTLHTQAVGESFTVVLPRFLRCDWAFDCFVTRVRLKQKGAGAINTGISTESSFSFIEGHNPPIDIPLQIYIPLPSGDDIFDIIIDPPIFVRGVVVHPDAYVNTTGPSSIYPEVDLYEIQIYAFSLGANTTMGQTGPNPTLMPARVACTGLAISPWAAGSSYPFANAEQLKAIQNLDFDIKSTNAIIEGGESVYKLGAYETDRTVNGKFAVELADYRLFTNLMQGQLTVDAANGSNGETQYWRPGTIGDRSGYFTLVGLSANGDPTEQIVMVKCKFTGVTRNLQRNSPTMWDVSFDLFFDTSYINQDGSTTGGFVEFCFQNTAGVPSLHS